jgi:hypothetical protein
MLHHALRAMTKAVVYFVTTAGSGSYLAPTWATKVTVEAIGGGGKGNGNSQESRRSGGGGGAYAQTTNLTVTGGSTRVYFYVGQTIEDSWVRLNSNAAPTSTLHGCKAEAGRSGNDSNGGAGGADTASVGTLKYGGADGSIGASAVGGGAAGDGGAAADQSGGAAITMPGGDGGNFESVGLVPGGGGGGSATLNNKLAGAVGCVRITFY